MLMAFVQPYLLFVIAAIAYEFLSEALIKRRQRLPGRITSHWSYKLMAGSYILLLLGTITEYLVLKRDMNLILSGLGLTMYISGHALRRWAVNSLGEYWSLHVEIREEHRLIRSGPYKILRHPNYLATILKGIGFVLVPNAYYLLAYSLLIFLPIRLLRIHLEEKELIKELGQEYLDYKRDVPAILPFRNLPVKFLHKKQGN